MDFVPEINNLVTCNVYYYYILHLLIICSCHTTIMANICTYVNIYIYVCVCVHIYIYIYTVAYLGFHFGGGSKFFWKSGGICIRHAFARGVRGYAPPRKFLKRVQFGAF